MLTLSAELQAQRKYFFDKCVKIKSPKDLLVIQQEIANAIRDCELRNTQGADKKLLKLHINRLRLYVDGLVWQVLHPHTIRQMAKNQEVPLPSIAAQGEAFDQVLNLAWDYFENYQVPVLIADITNILRIGDLIICVDSEVPLIVEAKSRLPNPKHLLQGRIGRQVSRAKGTLRYLRKGAAKVFGEDSYRQAVESSHSFQRNWSVITKICREAQNAGFASHHLSEYEVFWAYTPDNLNLVMDEMRHYEQQTDEEQMVFFGTSSGLIARKDGLFPPPIAWRIPNDLGFLLLEESIVIAHLIDARAFEHLSEDHERITFQPQNRFPVYVEVNGKEYHLSLRFIYDVLYGFETVGSCIEGLIEFAHDLNIAHFHSGMPLNVENASSTKPALHHVDSLEEAQLLVKSGDVGKNDLVSMPIALFQYFQQELFKQTDTEMPRLKDQEGKTGYAITDLEMLKQALR